MLNNSKLRNFLSRPSYSCNLPSFSWGSTGSFSLLERRTGRLKSRRRSELARTTMYIPNKAKARLGGSHTCVRTLLWPIHILGPPTFLSSRKLRPSWPYLSLHPPSSSLPACALNLRARSIGSHLAGLASCVLNSILLRDNTDDRSAPVPRFSRLVLDLAWTSSVLSVVTTI